MEAEICARYGIDHSPGPMMVVMPTEKLSQRWSKQRLKTMIQASPVLHGKIQPATARDGGNTTLMKEFPGGLLVIAGANSASDLRSMPARRVLCDEVDEYPQDLEGQGAPDEIAERRASTFTRRKVFKVSSPKLKATSVIWREFQAGDQRHYHVPCPHCGTLQPLDIDQLLPDGTYLCADGGCGRIIEEHHKPDMLADTAMGGTARWVAAKPDGEFPSFHINALYAPLGLGYTWAETATALAVGATAIHELRGCDVTGYPCTVAAQITTPLPDPDEPDRRLALLRPAAEAAWREAGLTGSSERLGVATCGVPQLPCSAPSTEHKSSAAPVTVRSSTLAPALAQRATARLCVSGLTATPPSLATAGRCGRWCAGRSGCADQDRGRRWCRPCTC